MRLRAEMAARVDERRGEPRRRLTGVQRARSRASSRETRRRRLRFPPARSSRSRRQPAARRDALGGVLQHRQLGGGERRQVAARAGASGCRDRGAACRGPSRARRRARSRTRRRTAAARSRSACTMRTLAAPLARDRAPQQIDAAIAHVAGDQQAAAFHQRGDRRRLAAGRGAGVEHARPARDRRRAASRAATLRPARRTSPAPGPSPRSGWPSSTIERRRARTRVGMHRRSSSRRRAVRASASRRRLQAVGAQRHRAGRVVELHPRFGGVEAEPIVASARRASADATA